jgi:hypothetical protein
MQPFIASSHMRSNQMARPVSAAALTFSWRANPASHWKPSCRSRTLSSRPGNRLPARLRASFRWSALLRHAAARERASPTAPVSNVVAKKIRYTAPEGDPHANRWG